MVRSVRLEYVIIRLSSNYKKKIKALSYNSIITIVAWCYVCALLMKIWGGGGDNFSIVKIKSKA